MIVKRENYKIQRRYEQDGKSYWSDVRTGTCWNPRQVGVFLDDPSLMFHLAQVALANDPTASAAIVSRHETEAFYPGPIELRKETSLFVQRKDMEIYLSFHRS